MRVDLKNMDLIFALLMLGFAGLNMLFRSGELAPIYGGMAYLFVRFYVTSE